MNKIKKYNETLFESIKHSDEYGNEYQQTRELQRVLEYKRWDKFRNVINNAQKAGVKNFDQFHNAGYKGLYNGETVADIAKRKNLRYMERRYIR